MAIKRVTPDEAAGLVGEGWSFVDVRSTPEYEAGHPAGAYNIPLMHAAPGGGMSQNSEFADVVAQCFAKTDPIVVGCKSGGRSYRAAQTLAELGFEHIVDMRGGFGGEVDRQTGEVTCPGWGARDLPVETEARPGRDYGSLAGKSSGE